MAEDTKLQGTNIASRIVPFDSQDTFPTHEAFYGKGGYRTVEDIAGRDAIPEQRLEVGMLVYCKNDPTGVHTYRYMGMKEGTSIRIWKELKLEGTGVPIYTNANVEEMRDAGVNVDEMDYITIPDDDDIEGEVTNKTYETTQNGTYVDILFKAIRALQSEVARLKNSFLYGIESYSGKNTAMSAISADLEEAIEEEPLWAVEEDGLSSVYDLFESDSITITSEFTINEDSTNSEVISYEDPSTNSYFVEIVGGPVTWNAIEKSELSEITDSKIFLYFTTTAHRKYLPYKELNFVIHLQEDYDNGTYSTIELDLRKLTPSVSSSNGVYNTLVVLSRSQPLSSVIDDEVVTNYYGKNYIWISVSDPNTNKTVLEGYWKDNKLFNIGEDGITSIDALIDPTAEDTSENNKYITYDGRLSVRSIDFYNTDIYKLHAYSKYQDFSNEVIPSKPSDENYKFKAAHITIRSVDTYKTLSEIKDNLLNNELILVEDNYKLYIKINDTLVALGSSQGEDPGDGGDSEDTGMNKEEIISWLKDNGIVVTENGDDSLKLNDIADITFKHEATGKTFKFTVNENGSLDSQEVTPEDKTLEAQLANYNFIDSSNIRGFIGQYRLRNNINQTSNAKLSSDRLKIGSFYAPLSSDIVHGCTHSFIELENTSDVDIPLTGIYLHVTRPTINQEGSVLQKIYSLELTGTIPSGGTYLIRGARHAEDNDVNAYIKVKTYDQEWYIPSEIDSSTNKLLSLEILEDGIDYSNKSIGYGICLTYGNSGFSGTNGQLTPTTPLITRNDNTGVYVGGGNILLTSSNIETYRYTYHKFFIDGISYYKGLTSVSDVPYWSGTEIGGRGNTMSNTLYKNTFELDPANQAYQALNGSDSSRHKWQNNTTDVQAVKLNNEYIVFPKTSDTFPVANYTPKASWEHKNVCTDKTKLDSDRPNMVTCSFGINIYTTRCFNWISLGYFDEYIWIKKTEENGQPISNTSWTKFESYRTISEELPESSNYPRRKEFNVTINNAVYARMTGRFPADNSFYTAHKVIVNITENPVNTKTVYTYVVGRADKNGNPDPEHTSREQTFTLYPTSYTTKIYQITDQQGFHWIEYQAWAAAADKLNEIIENEVNSSNIIPILINTGDMTQNGTRINEWYDYYQAGRNLFDHLEQMNCVGNNDLCGTNPNILGTGDDEGKSNSFYFHLFYCYEVGAQLDSNYTFEPICSGFGTGSGTPKYIPSLYYFDSNTDRFLIVNSEITATNSRDWFNLKTGNKDDYVNIYTGYSFNTESKIQTWQGDNFTPIYNMIYQILKNASESTPKKSVIVACHEMPFTVITHASLSNTDNSKTIDRSISSSKLVGSHLNQIHAKEVNDFTNNKTFQGTYWFSRLLEYFEVKLVIGGHKHTYACTYPIRENYNYVEDSVTKNSYVDGKMTMNPTLKDDTLDVFGTINGTRVNLTKFPYIKKVDTFTTTPDSNYFFPSIEVNAFIEDSEVTSGNFSGETYYTLVNNEYVIADSYSSGVTYYKKNPECSNFKGIVYFMCQATGYKLKSNKELPSTLQTYSKIIPKTTHEDTGDKPSKDQQYPMFSKIVVNNGQYSITLCRLTNILDSKNAFTQQSFGTGAITIESLTTFNGDHFRYGKWVNGENNVLFNNSYFTD